MHGTACLRTMVGTIAEEEWEKRGLSVVGLPEVPGPGISTLGSSG